MVDTHKKEAPNATGGQTVLSKTRKALALTGFVYPPKL